MERLTHTKNGEMVLEEHCFPDTAVNTGFYGTLIV